MSRKIIQFMITISSSIKEIKPIIHYNPIIKKAYYNLKKKREREERERARERDDNVHTF